MPPAAELIDDLLEQIDENARLQLAVWQAGYCWGEQPSSGAETIRASDPSDSGPRTYEVMGRRGDWLKCRATGSSTAFKVAMIRRDWVVEDDREKFDAILSRGSAS
jgi:hypothetical protein